MNVANLFISSPNQIAASTAKKLIADVTLSAPNTTISSGTIGAYSCIDVQVSWASRSGAVSPLLTFNGAGAGYNWRLSELGAAYATASGAVDSSITTEKTAANVAGQLEIFINNLSYNGNWILGNADLKTNIGTFDFNAAITSISLTVPAQTFPAGTRMIVTGL